GHEEAVRVLEFGTWREVAELKGHHNEVCYIQAMPGKFILTGDWKGILQVWNETNWEKIAELKSDSWASQKAAVSSDGKYLIYGGYIGIKVWETQTWKEIASLNRPKNLDCVALTPDGKSVITGGSNGMKVWKVDL
ncbi:MAG: WD40 repeat domain-containing protein, partial [Nitrospira sp.]|nr:WD40 repeat domain-containing protein [Nitrospira sp.]